MLCLEFRLLVIFYGAGELLGGLDSCLECFEIDTSSYCQFLVVSCPSSLFYIVLIFGS